MHRMYNGWKMQIRSLLARQIVSLLCILYACIVIIRTNSIDSVFLSSWIVLIPMAESPYGHIGHMMHAFLYGLDPSSPNSTPIPFHHTRTNTQCKYNRAILEPTPLGLVHLATSSWKSTKPSLQHFYNHSYTTPTAKEDTPTTRTVHLRRYCHSPTWC